MMDRSGPNLSPIIAPKKVSKINLQAQTSDSWTQVLENRIELPTTIHLIFTTSICSWCLWVCMQMCLSVLDCRISCTCIEYKWTYYSRYDMHKLLLPRMLKPYYYLYHLSIFCFPRLHYLHQSNSKPMLMQEKKLVQLFIF